MIPLRLSSLPLLLPALCFCGGAVIGSVASSWIIVALAIIAIITLFRRHYYVFAMLAIALTGITEGYFLIPRNAPAGIADRELWFTAQVIEQRESVSGKRLILNINAIGADSSSILDCRPFKKSAYIPDFSSSISEESTIRFSTTARHLSSGVAIPDYRLHDDNLRQRRIFLKCVIPPDNLTTLTAPQGILASLHKFADQSATRILASTLSPPAKEFLVATLIGDRSILDTDMRSDFATAGLAHILALSGLHLGVIAMIVAAMLFPLRAVGLRISAEFICLIIIWGYCFATGCAPSVCRATIMISVIICGRILHRYHNPFNSLCLAAIIITAASPESIFSPGFQLSFAAVATILLFARRLNPVNQQHRLLYNLTSYITVSLAAMIGTGLISILYFHTFPLYFLLSNIVIAVIFPPLLIAGIAFTVFAWIGYDPSWLISIIDFLYSLIEGITHFTTTLPLSQIDGIYLPSWVLIPYIATIVSFFLFQSHRITASLTTFISILSIIFAYSSTTPDSEPMLAIIPSSERTDIIYYRGSGRCIDIFTTANHSSARDAQKDATISLADYMSRRNIDSISVTPCSGKDDILSIGNKKLLIISNNEAVIPSDTHFDYMLVARRRRKPLQLSGCSIDSVIISDDLHPRTHAYFRLECRADSIPFISVGQEGHRISL